jgi:hypothetical protein
MASVRAKVKAITAPTSSTKAAHARSRGRAQPGFARLGNYFRWGNSTRKFTQIDSYVHERLALFDGKKRKKRGRRWAEAHKYAWFRGLGVHLLAGSIRWRSAATAAT